MAEDYEAIKKRRRENLEKIKRRKKASRVILFLCVILVFAGSYFFSWVKALVGFGSINFDKISTITYGSEVSYNKENVVQLANDKLLKAENGFLQLLEFTGDIIWQKTMRSSEIEAYGTDKFIYICDKNAGDVFVIDYSGNIISSIESLGLVESFEADGEYILLYLKDLKKAILLNSRSKIVTEIGITYEDIMDYEIEADLEEITMSVFEADGNGIGTNSLMYSFEGKMVGAVNFKDDILFKMNSTNKNFVGYTDTQITAFDLRNDNIWTYEIDRIINKIDFTEDGYSIVNLLKENQDVTDTRPENEIVILSPDGEKILEGKANVIVELLKLGRDKYAVVGDNSIYIYNFKGELLRVRAIDSGVIDIMWLDKDHLGFKYSDRFDVYKCY